MNENNQLLEGVRQDRRALHKIPELGLKEYKTKSYLLSRLASYACEINEIGPTGICAFFSSTNPQQQGTVAFRSDMDGLPTEEALDVPYRSLHTGVMHACGHDGHMAMLLGLAAELSKKGADLPQDVLLIFQPAEEGPGGAKLMIEAGILEEYDVRRMFALHVGPSERAHSIVTRAGAFMARSSELDIRIHGRSAHCSTPSKGIDALQIGCLLLSDLYQMEETILPKEQLRLLKFGKMQSGVVRNAISDFTLLQGTLRCYSDDVFDLLFNQIKQIASDYEKKYGCTIEIDCSDSYPAIHNDPELFRFAEAALSEFDFINLRKPVMAADDFSFFAQRVPGLYLFLGTGKKTPLHSDVFDFDEEILATGVLAYLALI